MLRKIAENSKNYKCETIAEFDLLENGKLATLVYAEFAEEMYWYTCPMIAR